MVLTLAEAMFATGWWVFLGVVAVFGLMGVGACYDFGYRPHRWFVGRWVEVRKNFMKGYRDG